MKKILLKNVRLIATIFILSIFLLPTNTYASDLEVDGFNIIPELTEPEIVEANKKIEAIWTSWWHVMENYRDAAEELTVKQQVATWIMNRDTITQYLIFVVKFLSQLWLVVWTIFIIYAGYKYMVSVFVGGKWATKDTILNAIIWVTIVIFSYAIMRILTSFIWLT